MPFLYRRLGREQPCDLVRKRKHMTYHNEYRRLWIDAGYRPDMGSACAVKPPPNDCIAAYYFTEAQYALDDIKNGHVKVTRISQANDPFEFEGLSATKPEVGREIRKWKDQADKTIGLLCFSKDWTSPALWAHYASRHTGICLGFWADKETIRTVVYDTERTDVGYPNAPPGLSLGMKDLLLTFKAYDWHYEEEIRRSVELSKTRKSGGNYYFDFYNDYALNLSEVILGARCSETVANVISVVHSKYNNVTVYKARPAIGFFKMVPAL